MTCRRNRLAILLASAVFGLASCGTPAPPLSPIERARAEIDQGDFNDARVQLQGLIEQGTDRREVAAYLGQAALATGDYKAAYGWLVDADFSDDTRALGYRMLGRLWMSQGNLPLAGKAFDKSYAVDPNNSDLWVDIGRLRYRGGEQLQALQAAERAIALDPKNPDALLFRGQLARDSEGLVAGSAWFARALDEDPENHDLRLEYAATLGDAGRMQDSLAVLRGGNGQAVATPRGLYLQAVIAARGGYDLLARELLQHSGFDRASVPSALMLSAIIDLEGDNYASAAQTLDRLYTLQPDNPRVVDLLAFALSRSGSDRELVYRFASRAESALGSPYLQTLVGRSYEALDDRAKAARFLDLAARPAAQLVVLPSATSPEALGIADDGGGFATRDYVRNALIGRQAAAAVRRARDFARRFPGSGDAFSMLGDAEMADGNKVAAREAYLRSATVRRPWPLVLRLAGSETDPASARRVLEDYVRNNPMNGEACAMLADAYAAERQWDKAALLLDHAMMLGQHNVPWVLAARGLAASELGHPQDALDFALEAHAIQPMNPAAIAALIAVLPAKEVTAKSQLETKLRSLMRR
jgi:tetratricopeptide (TPR) repeat protein